MIAEALDVEVADLFSHTPAPHSAAGEGRLRTTEGAIIDGLLQIRDAKSASVIKEMLISYLPEQHRAELEEAAA